MEIERDVSMKSKELRVIPKKNYIILGIVIIVTLCLLYYFYMWFDAYNETRLNKPILNKYMEIINYNEIDNYIVENPNTVIYVSVLENESIRNFEKKVKNSFRDNDIDIEILYLDMTENIKDKEVLQEIEYKYSLNSLSMKDIPCVIIFENGRLDTIYSIQDNDYDIDKFLRFVNNIVFDGGDGFND